MELSFEEELRLPSSQYSVSTVHFTALTQAPAPLKCNCTFVQENVEV